VSGDLRHERIHLRGLNPRTRLCGHRGNVTDTAQDQSKGSTICTPAGSKCRLLWVGSVWPWKSAVPGGKAHARRFLSAVRQERVRNLRLHPTVLPKMSLEKTEGCWLRLSFPSSWQDRERQRAISPTNLRAIRQQPGQSQATAPNHRNPRRRHRATFPPFVCHPAICFSLPICEA